MWKVQEPFDLVRSARERWNAEKPLQCPGIAIGQFESDNKIAYAILLVPQTRSASGYKFLVFSPMDGSTKYATRVVEQSIDDFPWNLFIRQVAIGKFFDAHSREKFHARTRDGILFVDAGETEYETDIYFWVNGKSEHQPVDY